MRFPPAPYFEFYDDSWDEMPRYARRSLIKQAWLEKATTEWYRRHKNQIKTYVTEWEK
jgi:hypothetical protein